jgi:GH43 family beta-xylosidase
VKQIFPALFCLYGMLAAAQTATLATDAIRVRDPFIFADAPSQTYYLYAQAENRAGSGYQGVEVYTSTDLKTWKAPRPVLTLPADSGVAMVWAPEMHAYQGAYYLFVTLTFRDTLPVAKPVDAPHWPRMHRRGTWIYRAESPAGPFKPLKDGPHTPADWMALDGTLYVEDGTPYMIFCHEWVQLIDGAMARVELTPDLSGTRGEPVRLFSASAAPGARRGAKEGKVTDGPFLYKSPKSGALFMIWSTFIPGKDYCVLLARSESGRVAGPWTGHTPIYTTNGGHGMIFKTFEGQLRLALHQPNTGPLERLRLFGLTDDGTALRLESE